MLRETLHNMLSIYVFFFFILCYSVSSCATPGDARLRIVGGQDANITDYPYQVSIQFYGRHGCGGSILTEFFILTAAHCTFDVPAENTSVRVGSSYRNRGGRVYEVSDIYYHPQFSPTTYDYDVSVLRLSSNLVFGAGVRKVSLATEGTNINDGLMATASGWGLLYEKGPPANQLQVVGLPVISTEKCFSYYPEGYVTDRMFCAGYDEGGKDTCVGDSGGPLVVSGIQIGITSWGIVCAGEKVPGAYTKIPLFVDYIDSIIDSSLNSVE